MNIILYLNTTVEGYSVPCTVQVLLGPANEHLTHVQALEHGQG